MSIRWFAAVLAAAALAGCGGGDGGDGSSADDPAQGTVQSLSISSRQTGTPYPLSIYLPPASAGARKNLPVIYALDGESWFQTLVGIVEALPSPAIVVAIQTAGQRSRDFVPANNCTSNGGGHERYLAFIREELIPFIESSVGGDPAQRVLFGHSHGGSFVLYAMWADAPAQHHFKAYLASDASISCMSVDAAQWEQAYAAAYTSLPVRLQLSYATQGNYQPNLDYGQAIARRRYEGLTLMDRAYNGSHTGIVPQVLADGLPFALGAR